MENSADDQQPSEDERQSDAGYPWHEQRENANEHHQHAEHNGPICRFVNITADRICHVIAPFARLQLVTSRVRHRLSPNSSSDSSMALTAAVRVGLHHTIFAAS